jgi:hypothetical protein
MRVFYSWVLYPIETPVRLLQQADTFCVRWTRAHYLLYYASIIKLAYYSQVLMHGE